MQGLLAVFDNCMWGDMTMIISNLKLVWKRYRDDISGQFAVITGLIGIPLLLIAAGALDVNRAASRQLGLGAAVDSAALAAVIPDNLSDAARKAYAKKVFDKNYFGSVPATLTISGNREKLHLVATAHVPTLFSSIIGIKSVKVQREATAVLTRKDIVCLLILDPDGNNALEFRDEATFNAPSCSVQVNSTNRRAMVSTSSVTPKAQSFCTSGISVGRYWPVVKNACSPIDDPYADLLPPPDGPCIRPERIQGYIGSQLNNHGTPFHLPLSPLGTDTFGDDAVLIPGTYCNGLKIRGRNVILLPGNYIIKNNPLEISEGSQVIGKDVTFFLKDKANLVIKSNAQVFLKAPKDGAYSGLVIFNVPLDRTAQNIARRKAGRYVRRGQYPENSSLITSGGGMQIVGTAYFPSQSLVMSSDSPSSSQSPATSFIAYRMKFEKRANMVVHIDYEKGGVPPLQPRSDDGARLLR